MAFVVMVFFLQSNHYKHWNPVSWDGPYLPLLYSVSSCCLCFCFLFWSMRIFLSYFLCPHTPALLKRGVIEALWVPGNPSKANQPQKKLLEQNYTEWLIILRLKTKQKQKSIKPCRAVLTVEAWEIQNINCYTSLFIFIPGQFVLNYFLHISHKSEKGIDHL